MKTTSEIRKPKINKARVKEALETIMKIRTHLVNDRGNDLWKHNEALQTYHDCLRAFQKAGVIADYDLRTSVIDYGE